MRNRLQPLSTVTKDNIGRRPGRSAVAGLGVLALAAALSCTLPGVAAADPVRHPHTQPTAGGPLRQPGVQDTASCALPANADDEVLKTLEQHLNDHQVSYKVRLSTYEAAWVESHVNNLPCGDGDSIGVFQQRPSEGWCTEGDCMDVNYAVDKFLEGNPDGSLGAMEHAQEDAAYTSGEVAQLTQRSAAPDRYDNNKATAEALMKRAAEINPEPLPPADYQWPTLTENDQSTRVTVAQLLLNANGATLEPDGAFGPLTAAAVKKFQTAKGLQVTGAVDAPTWQKLVTPVKDGSTGPAAEAVEWELQAQGYPIQPDQTYDAATAKQVTALRAYYRLPDGDSVDVDAWKALVH